jgi:type I restriction enzyme S subunit
MKKQLPKNWIETHISAIAVTSSGGTPSTTKKEYWDGNIPWINSGKLKDEDIFEPSRYITELGLKESSAKLFPIDTVVIALTGATTGKLGYLKLETSTNQSVTGIFPNKFYNSKLLFYQLRNLRNEILSQALGSAQPHINKKIVDDTLIKFPPLAEQNRIVAKLDTLFAQLETIKASMAKVPLLLKDFRQQVLTQAVTGKLTEEWRKGKELEGINIDLDKINTKELLKVSLKPLELKFILPKKWEWYNLQYLCSKITDGEHITPELTNEGIPLLSAKDVRTNYLDFSDVKYVNEITANKSRARCNPEKGDILVVSRGATVGRSTIVGISDVFCLMGSVLLFKPLNKYIDSKYLEYYFKSTLGLQDIISRSGATAQQAVYIRDMKEFGIPLPPHSEQQEIVFRVESLFAKADAIEKQYENLKAKIESLPQAILHKAFKGELIEQLDSDGDARELLKEIEGLKRVQQDKGKKGKSKTNTSVTQKV